jgi:pyruvate-ferredoxin/flavodoxin oxidoreductase
MMMAYGNVYVAQVSLGANMQQLIKALTEAESYDGPSIVIAYTPCIAHGVSMSRSVEEEKRAVACGYWHLFRFDPRRKELGERPFQLDSKKPTAPLREFLAGENRFRVLNNLDSESAREMLDQAEKDSQELYALYEKLASS